MIFQKKFVFKIFKFNQLLGSRLDPSEEPINRNHVPEVREIDDLYLEDNNHKDLYRVVVDEDEEITVTGGSGEEAYPKLE